MKQKLEAKGWVMYYQCSRCGGKQYFTNAAYPNYEVRTKPRGHTFSIMLESHVIGGPFHEYQLEGKLVEFLK